MDHAFSTKAEQVALRLREQLKKGRWTKTIPGRNRLAAELGVNHKTVKTALAMLEAEGLIQSHGPGRERTIIHASPTKAVGLRIAILSYEKYDLMTQFLMEIVHRLRSAGHTAHIAEKSLNDLSMDVSKVAELTESTEADAWIVVAGSFEVLDWFASKPTPTFALFGRFPRLPIAGAAPHKSAAMQELVDRLVDFGHRRIVMLAREERRKPTPGEFEQSYLSHLETHGIRVGSYHLPDWGDTPEDLEQTLASLFLHTPPTALIIGDEQLFVAVVQQLARLGLVIPDHVSLACTDSSSAFVWCRPPVTHISWNRAPVVNRIINWANNSNRGRDDRKHLFTKARLVPGGTIGPVPKASST